MIQRQTIHMWGSPLRVIDEFMVRAVSKSIRETWKATKLIKKRKWCNTIDQFSKNDGSMTKNTNKCRSEHWKWGSTHVVPRRPCWPVRQPKINKTQKTKTIEKHLKAPYSIIGLTDLADPLRRNSEGELQEGKFQKRKELKKRTFRRERVAGHGLNLEKHMSGINAGQQHRASQPGSLTQRGSDDGYFANQTPSKRTRLVRSRLHLEFFCCRSTTSFLASWALLARESFYGLVGFSLLASLEQDSP